MCLRMRSSLPFALEAALALLLLTMTTMVRATTLVKTCLNGTSPAPFLLESLDGSNDLGITIIDSMGERIGINGGSIAASNPGFGPARVAVSYSKRVVVVDVSDPATPRVMNQCWTPLVPSLLDGERHIKIHCVAYIGPQLYVVYEDEPQTLKGRVATLNEADCTFSDIVNSPARVAGSMSGPGGQCVGFDETRQIAWLSNVGLSKFDKIGVVIFDADSGVATLFTNVSDAFGAQFGSLMADQRTNHLYWYAARGRNSSLTRLDMKTLQETNKTSLLSDVGNIWSIYMDSFGSHTTSSRLVVVNFTSIISIPLSGDPISVTQRSSNPAICNDHGAKGKYSEYEHFLSFVNFPATTTAVPTATRATQQPNPWPNPTTAPTVATATQPPNNPKSNTNSAATNNAVSFSMIVLLLFLRCWAIG